jgi:hypothetical protein
MGGSCHATRLLLLHSPFLVLFDALDDRFRIKVISSTLPRVSGELESTQGPGITALSQGSSSQSWQEPESRPM